MDRATLVLQIITALGIYNVWLLRAGKATNWRGGDAKTMEEEFAVYGLPPFALRAVGLVKLVLATLLVAGIWFPVVTQPAALALAVLMLGAVAMHIKVKDPLEKSLPALTMLVLCLVIALV